MIPVMLVIIAVSLFSLYRVGQHRTIGEWWNREGMIIWMLAFVLCYAFWTSRFFMSKSSGYAKAARVTYRISS